MGVWLPILIMLGLGLGVAFAVGNVALSQFLGPKKPTPEKLAACECGMPLVDDAREARADLRRRGDTGAPRAARR